MIRAEIGADLRKELEELGTALVAQILAVPPTIQNVNSPFPHFWFGPKRTGALAWLREKHLEDDRRRDINEAMEVAIIILVLIEAISAVANWIRRGI